MRRVMRNGTAGRVLAAITFALAVPLALGSAAAQPAHAAGALSYSQVKLSVWPEYDDPRVLVIMEPVLADSVQLPARVSFVVPKGAKINMACEITESGGHNCRPQQLTSKGKFDEIAYTASSRRTLFFEYYYDAGFKGADHKFTFDYIPTYRVDNLNVEIQQPLKAASFKVTPTAASTASDKQGFTYHQYTYSNLAQNKPLPFTVGYTKTDPSPSVKKTVGNDSSGGNQQSAAGSNNLSSVLGVLGVVALLGTIAYWMLPIGRRALSPATGGKGGASTRVRPQTGSKKKSKKTAPARAPRAVSFCSNCGNRVKKDENFCTVCGRDVA